MKYYLTNSISQLPSICLFSGDLPSAVLLFEAAVQQDPGNAEAWALLGTSQAKNEKDPSAIAALKQSLTLNPGNQEVIMSLAASFTNESYQAHACHALQGQCCFLDETKSVNVSASDWINHHPEYSKLMKNPRGELTVFEKPLTSSFMTRELQDETIEMFLKAARLNNSSKISVFF